LLPRSKLLNLLKKKRKKSQSRPKRLLLLLQSQLPKKFKTLMKKSPKKKLLSPLRIKLKSNLLNQLPKNLKKKKKKRRKKLPRKPKTTLQRVDPVKSLLKIFLGAQMKIVLTIYLPHAEISQELTYSRDMMANQRALPSSLSTVRML
jgi:hypothetical protein